MSSSNGRRQPPMQGLVFDKQPLYQAASHIGHTSPPDTPATSRTQSHPRSVHILRPPVPDPNIRPVGNGHQFSYQPSELPSPGPSPTSSSSSGASSDGEEGDVSSIENYRAAALGHMSNRESVAGNKSSDGDDDDSASDSEASSEESEDGGSTNSPRRRSRGGSGQHSSYAEVRFTRTYVAGDFVIEDVDPMDSENDGLEVLQPTEIESNRSRSRSRQRELPRRMMRDMRNLTCDTDTSDEEEADVTEETFYKWQEHLRRRRVSLSSSIGKRTFSERSSDSGDSDSGGLDVNEVGSSARRMRKRMHRGSLLFQDPPEPRIDELEEPNSSEDERLPLPGQSLAQELPYWTLEIMEMEDSG